MANARAQQINMEEEPAALDRGDARPAPPQRPAGEGTYCRGPHKSIFTTILGFLLYPKSPKSWPVKFECYTSK